MKQNLKLNIESNKITTALSSCKIIIKYILLFGVLVNLLMLSTPLFSMQVLDRVLGSGNLNTLVMLLLVIILALFLLSLIQGSRSFAMNKLGSWFENKLSTVVLSNALKKSLEFKSINSQPMRDLQTVKTFITSPNLIAIMDMPWAIIFIIVLFVLHKMIGFLAITSVVILVVFGIITDRSTKYMMETNNENFIKSMRYIDQVTKNSEVIEVMGMRDNVINLWQNLNMKVQQIQNLIVKRRIIFMEITRFFRIIIQISVTSLGAYLCLKGEFTSGAIIASSSLVGRALTPFEMTINSWKALIDCKKSYLRLANTLVNYIDDSGKMDLPSPNGEITVENLYYTPLGIQKYILKAVNFSLRSGDVIAMIGPSASGKTTLAKLLVGALYPSIGNVRIDNASTKDWKKSDIGPYIGYLPQDSCLLNGTIKENIARMNKKSDSVSVIAAAQIAGVHEMIMGIPNTYDANIGCEGEMLSGGQKQRIGLARAFYGNPKFIVLDEPNSSLDTIGEQALMSAIEFAKESKITTVIISHKNSILDAVDKILVLKDGMVSSFGSKEQMFKKLNQVHNYSREFKK